MPKNHQFPFQSVSHFPLLWKVANCYAKETTMYLIRAPPQRWRIHHALPERPFSINSERAVHLAGCAALFVFHSTEQVRLL
jgi:hypothetical protein